MKPDHAVVHAQLTLFAERLLIVSERFAEVGAQIGRLCEATNRLIDAEYGTENGHGT